MPTGEMVSVAYPFTLEFQVTRSKLASANTAKLTLLNLGKTTREALFWDYYNPSVNHPILKLQAGYVNDITQPGAEYDLTGALKGANLFDALPTVYTGQVFSAYSQRVGTEYRTEITCFDGGTALTQGQVSTSIAAGASQSGIIGMLMEALPGVDGKTVGLSFVDQIKRGIVLFGNPAEILKQATGDKFYIDSQDAFALDIDEVIQGDMPEITSDSGLLGSPRRGQATLELDMIFEPRLKPSQAIVLNSSTESNYNGTYKVMGFSHQGVISGAIGGTAVTRVNLFAGKVFRAVG